MRSSFITYVLLSVSFCAGSWFLYDHVAQREPHCDIDSKAYLQRGQLFADTNSFVNSGEAQPYYTFGYAFIIGILWKIFGKNVGIIILFQLLLSLLSGMIMVRMTRRLFGRRASVIASILFACNVGYLVFTQFILTEIVLSFFLLAAFEQVLLAMTAAKNPARSFAYAGLLFGLSVIVKPAALYFVPLLAGVMACLRFVKGSCDGYWLRLQEGASFDGASSSVNAPSPKGYGGTGATADRQDQLLAGARPELVEGHERINHTINLSSIILLLTCFAAPIIGYMSYNKVAFNSFHISNLDHVNIYYWFFPNVLAKAHGTTSDYERAQLLKLSDGHHDAAVVAPLFWQELRSKPMLFIKVWLTNVTKTLLGLYTTNLKVLVEEDVKGGDISFFKMHGTVFDKAWQYVSYGATHWWVMAIGLFEAFWHVIRYLFCLAGLWLLYRRRYYNVLVLCLLYLAYFSLITGHDGCARFRMMFEFLLIILAAGGLDYCNSSQATPETEDECTTPIDFDLEGAKQPCTKHL